MGGLNPLYLEGLLFSSLTTEAANRDPEFPHLDDDGLLHLVGGCSAVAQTPDFLDQSEAAGLLGSYLNHSASVADYDLDGDLDVYVGSRLASNTLYRNEGNATFVPVVAGVEDEGFTMATLFFDYDNDGDPDLLSCNTADANHFWRNDGGGLLPM